MSDIAIRPATEADLAAINDIYNHYVLTCTCTYQEEPEPLEGRKKWFENHDEKHPVIVAEADGAVIGWASLSKFHQRSAYRHTVENSVYIHHEHHRRGVGSALLAETIKLAGAGGFRAIIAGIDAEQTASVALHAKFGFEKVAHLKQVGFKFGRWLDTTYMELLL
jgi:L-amino acid N-acyltransferase